VTAALAVAQGQAPGPHDPVERFDADAELARRSVLVAPQRIQGLPHGLNLDFFHAPAVGEAGAQDNDALRGWHHGLGQQVPGKDHQ
jgi:hypothetical protein